MKKHTFFLILSMVLILEACSGLSKYPDDITRVLEFAGENRVELEKVLTHYENGDDSLKLKAAYYLIGNMEEHCYVTYNLIDTAGEIVDFNVLDFPDYDSLVTAATIIEKERGEMDYEKADKIYDSRIIKAEYLINHIELAFEAWQTKPWAHNLSFDDFCFYILPYRGSNEPLEEWREFFMKRYEHLSTLLKDSTDVIEAAAHINDDVMNMFGFDPRFYYHPTDQGLSEMIENKLGRCEDMTNFTIYAMRANGLAVTSDYTPYWANNGNNHAWNSILIPGGDVIPFMGAESSPGKYKLHYKFAKVYRKMYNKNPENLVFQPHQQEKLPRWLSGKSYKDVTADYTDVVDLNIDFDKAVPDSVDIAYICVFNSGQWKPIHWGRIENNKVVFTDMAPGIAYLPALYLNEEVVPYGPAFILNEDKSYTYLIPDNEKATKVALTSTTKRTQDKSTQGNTKTFLTEGVEYELFYYDFGWQSLGSKTAGKDPLRFENVPENSLLWLVAKDSNREERIFTIEDDQQAWW